MLLQASTHAELHILHQARHVQGWLEGKRNASPPDFAHSQKDQKDGHFLLSRSRLEVGFALVPSDCNPSLQAKTQIVDVTLNCEICAGGGVVNLVGSFD